MRAKSERDLLKTRGVKAAGFFVAVREPEILLRSFCVVSFTLRFRIQVGFRIYSLFYPDVSTSSGLSL
jgi:hypothetical protein